MKNKFWIIWQYITSFCLLLLTTLTFAQNSSQNQDGVKKIVEGIYMISNIGGNITVLERPDGLLVIDTGEKVGKLDSVISTFSKNPIKYILNTNFHFDHVGDNQTLCDKGATIIAHKKTRDVLAAGWEAPEVAGVKFPKFPPVSAKYLPRICFNDTLDLYFNDNVIQAIHYPLAHSSGDAIYYFRNQNIIHVGDLFVLYGYPYIDSYHGGTIDGLIKAVDDILKLCDDKTILIPGHGKISNRQELSEYREMLVETRATISKLVHDGKTLNELIKLDPIGKLMNGRKVEGFKDVYIAVIYNELTL